MPKTNDRVATETSGGQARIEVVLVDDHAILRGGIRSMLEDTEFSVVGEAASGNEACELLHRMSCKGNSPRIVVLDIRMDDGDGLETLQVLKNKYPALSVVMLTTYDNPTYVARAVAYGAAGYLLKGAERDEMLDTLRAVAGGEMLLKMDELTRLLRGISEETVAQSDDLIHPLSARELEVLRLLATGLSNRDIGRVLFISECTVKSHVGHIIDKLDVSDRVQAAVWAARRGLLSESK